MTADAQTPPIDVERADFDQVAALEQFQSIREWIGAGGGGDFVNKRFTRKNARRSENRTPRAVPHRYIHRDIRSLNRRDGVRDVIHAPRKILVVGGVSGDLRLLGLVNVVR